jgi:hypothetical protein
VIKSPSGNVGVAGRCPTVSRRAVSCAAIKIGVTDVIPTAPNDHFRTTPDCGVMEATGRGIGGGRGCPTVSAGSVLATGSLLGTGAILATPNNHLAPGPDSSVIEPASGCAGRACRSPTVS